MNESMLARDMLDAVLHYAALGGARRIHAVRGWVADAQSLSRESFCTHFASHALGTEAEGARLELELRRVEARCRGCTGVYMRELKALACPTCGGTEAELL